MPSLLTTTVGIYSLAIQSMSYNVKEIFYTLQGEGANTGMPAVFCRFTGCNLWSGREVDRSGAICRFCDTDFVGSTEPNGGRYATASVLADKISCLWPSLEQGERFAVLTGGEPLLQVDQALIDDLHAAGFRIAVETNGTLRPPQGVDWVCVSPKAGAPLQIQHGNELKVVWPQSGLVLADLEKLDFDNFFLQPLDDDLRDENLKICVETCLRRPKWRLSLQTHKIIGIQ